MLISDLKARDEARSILRGTARAVEQISERCRTPQFTEALTVFVSAGKSDANTWVTGIGKSGFVARRAAASWASVGLCAHFLNPVDLLHGDLGRTRAGDLVIFISQSGVTAEVLMAADVLRVGTHVGITGDPLSPLAERCEVVLDSSVEDELIPYQATAAQSAWCDALTAGWCASVQVSFKTNHPGGAIGAR